MQRPFQKKNKRHGMVGLSLLEVMLVLAIAALIIIFSIRQYESWQNDMYFERLQYNVDALFQSMQFYYKAQCGGQYNPNYQPAAGYNPYPTENPGTLNPIGQTVPIAPLQLDIQKDLVMTGFLTVLYPFPINPLVANETQNNKSDTRHDKHHPAYAVQFNILTILRTQAVATSSTPEVTGTAVRVQMQVSVKLSTTDPQTQLSTLHLLNGTCLGATPDATCSVATYPGQGRYVIWERIPSLASSHTQTDFWQTDASLTQFTRQYTTYPVTYLTGTAEGNQPPTQYQYYLCGD